MSTMLDVLSDAEEVAERFRGLINEKVPEDMIPWVMVFLMRPYYDRNSMGGFRLKLYGELERAVSYGELMTPPNPERDVCDD